jgi:hypothetical protein
MFPRESPSQGAIGRPPSRGARDGRRPQQKDVAKSAARKCRSIFGYSPASKKFTKGSAAEG